MRLLSLWLSCLLLLAACSANEPGPTAYESLLLNGEIYTVDEERPWAEALAIRDGRIAWVGSTREAHEFAAHTNEIFDLGGRMVMPGIVDAHTHPGLIDRFQYDVSIDVKGRHEFLAALADAAVAAAGDDDWLTVWCWPTTAFVDGKRGPDRSDLDRIFPQRPVWIMDCEWHSYWLNTAALDRLGIDESTPDPRFPVAMYQRDESGRLTGWVKEGAGWQHFVKVFDADKARHRAAVRSMLQRLSEYGVTTLYDAGNMGWADDVYGFIASLERAGELPLRYEGTYMVAVPDARHSAVAAMQRLRRDYGGERLQFNTIKLFMDGVHENRSGAVLKPYADYPGYRANTMLTVDELREFLVELHHARLNLHVHAIGGLAVRRVLDAVAAARDNVGDDFYPRVSMGHLQNMAATEWPRFAALDVSANFTPWWMGVDVPDLIGAGLERARAEDTYRAQALLDNGANVTFSSDDWSLPVLSPYLGMQVGHTRRYPREWLADGDDPDAIRLPASERLAIDDLIRGYTLNGAYQLRKDAETGSIEVGKAADLVVLPANLFELAAEDLHTVRPLAVMIAGEWLRTGSERLTGTVEK